jgi:hypothetical protein
MTFRTIVVLATCAAMLAACAHQPQVATRPGLNLGPGNLGAAGLANDGVDSLRAAYGNPQLVRKEADAELWRYDGDKCSAFFFLYTVDGGLHVRFIETLPRGSDAPADANCLKAIRSRVAATS